MKKAKSAVIVPKGMKSKSLDFVGKHVRAVDVYQFEHEEMLWEAEELCDHYEDVVIIVKTSK